MASDAVVTAPPDESATVVVIGGPTASGKSALAVRLAGEFGGTVINADSMQLYDALPILTAQPSATDRQVAPHALYGVLPADSVGTAQAWREMALVEISRAVQAGRLPVVVGGTGLYLRTLMQGLSPMPDIPDEVRSRVRALWDDEGADAVRSRLGRLDPAAVARLKPGDRQRRLRALEVVEATGRSLSDWQNAAAEGTPPGLRFATIVLRPERESLREAIAGRFKTMLADGALDEAAKLLARNLPAGRPIMRAVGLPQLRRHLSGEIERDQAVTEAIIATRQYAKRQDTWFRHQFIAGHVVNSQYSEKNLPEIFSFIRRFGLTGPA